MDLNKFNHILNKSYELYIDRIQDNYHLKVDEIYTDFSNFLYELYGEKLLTFSPSFTSDQDLTWFIRFKNNKSVFISIYLDDLDCYVCFNSSNNEDFMCDYNEIKLKLKHS